MDSLRATKDAEWSGKEKEPKHSRIELRNEGSQRFGALDSLSPGVHFLAFAFIHLRHLSIKFSRHPTQQNEGGVTVKNDDGNFWKLFFFSQFRISAKAVKKNTQFNV